MSSGDEFGGYAITPAKPQAVAKKSTGSRAPRAAPVAGPSSKPAPKKNGKKAPSKDVEEAEDDEVAEEKDVMVVVDSDDEEPEPVKETVAKTKGKAAQGRTTRAGAKTTAKNKGVNRAVEQVEEIGVVDATESAEEEPPAQRPTRNGRAAKATESKPQQENTRQVKAMEALRRKNERLEQEAEQLSAQITKLEEQMEELFRIRNTEPEEIMAQQAAMYEEKIRTQEELLREQQKLIAASKSSSGSGHMLQFLSREAADEEKKGLQEELDRMREKLQSKDALIASKDEQFLDLQAERDMIQAELKAEVERSKSLLSRNPPPIEARTYKRGGMSESADPKLSAVFTLYEDITNLLVLKVKLDKGPYPGTEDKIFDCVYTAPSKDGEPVGNLHFTLRSLYELAPDADPNQPISKQLVAKMQYEPLDLDKERPEYVERLDFFRDPFVFQYDQLHVFLKSLVDRVPQTEGNSEEDDEAADMEMDDT
ncbi:hypothetical protein EIP91_001680 [Steccherinum ochraceum]|uniref:Monopolin complex subunit Csm1/Pcs1 C-terminal domain-containing protein n=1 Tax=Steccherinum ochraceum TaxID=92696 RepID=A0A4R0RFZ3_9APHY|nr:hypothetical protein EIP91_001680 [Steccherinum ochraceum]